jgi:iron complex outermembrane receptor protein
VTVTDANTAQVAQVGNAKRTNRLGAELLIDWQLAQSLFRNNDAIRGLVNWNWVQAAFDDDDNFHDNKLPVVTPHTIYSELSYLPVSYLKVAANLQHVPRGAYVDYANSFRDDGYSVFGARIEWDHKSWRAFVDASNLNNVKYAATVIGAQNNASSTDGLFFAPGEPRSLTVGVGYQF